MIKKKISDGLLILNGTAAAVLRLNGRNASPEESRGKKNSFVYQKRHAEINKFERFLLKLILQLQKN